MNSSGRRRFWIAQLMHSHPGFQSYGWEPLEDELDIRFGDLYRIARWESLFSLN